MQRNATGHRIPSRHFWFWPVLAIAVSGLALSGCGNKDLTQKPPRSATTATFDTQPSTVGALVNLSLAELTSLVNQKVPANFSAGGNGDDVCKHILVGNICVGTNYSFNAQRTGAISVSAAGSNGLQVSLPISFYGSGGFRGTGANLLGLNKKNFSGAISVNATLTPTLSDDWCPKLGASFSYSWTSNPRVEVVSGVWVDIKSLVESKVNEQLPKLVAAAANAIDCTKFKADLASVYGSRTFPVDIPGVGKVHINVSPTDIGFSGLKVDATSLKAAALITAKIEVATKPLVPQQLPLPKLKTIPVAAPKISLHIPVRVSYDTLSAALSKALVGQSFSSDTPAGKVSVVVKGIEVFPSKDRLVVGITFAADLPGTSLDTKGTVYLLAKPSIQVGTKLDLAHADYSATLNNAFWEGAAVVFNGPVREAVAKAGAYDFSGEIQKVKESLAKTLADPTAVPNMKLSLSDVDIRGGLVAVADKELAVEAIFSATATIEPKLAVH